MGKAAWRTRKGPNRFAGPGLTVRESLNYLLVQRLPG